MTTPPADKIATAVSLLRANPTDAYYAEFVALTAELLARIAPLAPYWSEPYAAPFVPIIEQASRLADWIVTNRERVS